MFLSENPSDDASDEDDNDKEQYHPRCLLLSGPPQVCFIVISLGLYVFYHASHVTVYAFVLEGTSL